LQPNHSRKKEKKMSSKQQHNGSGETLIRGQEQNPTCLRNHKKYFAFRERGRDREKFKK